MALTDKLTAIANAIRTKTGKTATLTLEQMHKRRQQWPRHYTVLCAVAACGHLLRGGKKINVYFK